MSLQSKVYSLQKKYKSHFDEWLSTVKFQLSTGFTLIELLAVMGIIVIISTVVLASNTKFGGAVVLQNLAYDIALSIRQAQVYGIAVRGAGASNFNAGYGMHFDTSIENGTKMYQLFADLNSNGVYDPPPDLLVAPSEIGRNYSIYALCVDGTECNPVENPTNVVNKLDIVFRRPEPDAYISADSNSCPVLKGLNCKSKARIVVISPRGDKKDIVIEKNGQIYVQSE